MDKVIEALRPINPEAGPPIDGGGGPDITRATGKAGTWKTLWCGPIGDRQAKYHSWGDYKIISCEGLRRTPDAKICKEFVPMAEGILSKWADDGHPTLICAFSNGGSLVKRLNELRSVRAVALFDATYSGGPAINGAKEFATLMKRAKSGATKVAITASTWPNGVYPTSQEVALEMMDLYPASFLLYAFSQQIKHGEHVTNDKIVSRVLHDLKTAVSNGITVIGKG